MIKENALITIFKKDPSRAFKLLYLEYYSPLCLFATKFTQSSTISEEIVQDTFMKFWEKKEYKNIQKNLISYLYQIVRNNCLNYLKHEQIVNQYKEEVSSRLRWAETYFSLSHENGQSVILAYELDEKIKKEIENLPEQCKKFFKLSRFEGLKNPEIAKKEGVTINTVQKQISIALTKLRDALKDFL
jgi:RNA polymerase sigma-70 factor (ECF subfamily)